MIKLIRHQLACLKGIASVVRFNPGNAPTTSVTATQTIITSKSVPHNLSTPRAAAVSWLRNMSWLLSRDLRRLRSRCGSRWRCWTPRGIRSGRRLRRLLSRNLRRCGCGLSSRQLSRVLSGKRSWIHCGLRSRFNCRTPRGLWCTIACFWITHGPQGP